MGDFREMFVSSRCIWDKDKGITEDINELSTLWKNEDFLKSRRDFQFNYLLEGLKKAGTEAFNCGFVLVFKIETFWWGFSLMNYNNQQPFYKKLYHEQLEKKDIEQIVEIVYNKVLDEIDMQLAFLKNKNQ